MKKIFIPLIVIATMTVAFTTGPADEIKTISTGTRLPMPAHKMKDVTGRDVALQDLKGENGLLVVFSCNTCPFVIGNDEDNAGWEGRYNEVADSALKHKIGMVLVNSNEAKRDAGDSFDDMVKRYTEKGFKCRYVLDTASVMANAFGAKTTPHVFLFDKNLQLVYRGAIDDNVRVPGEVKDHYLFNVMADVTAGKKPRIEETKPVGCSIKRVAVTKTK
ncbi:MAG: redoxin family protein [Flavobacteriales bacterium]